MDTIHAENHIVKYVVDVRASNSAGKWGGYVRVWIKPIFADGTMATGHDPRSITIARSVSGRSSRGPKTAFGRALAAAAAEAARMNARLEADLRDAYYVMTGGAE